MTALVFFVPGVVSAQGSKRHVGRGILVDQNANSSFLYHLPFRFERGASAAAYQTPEKVMVMFLASIGGEASLALKLTASPFVIVGAGAGIIH